MSHSFVSKCTAVAALVGSLMGSVPARGQEFPTEPAYRALYASAMNQGYRDIADGVAVFHRYRGGVEQCVSREHSESTKAFGEFLDSIVYEFQGYLGGANLRSRGVRNGIADYVTHCAALIELYARKKAGRFNGGETRLDAEDENLVATSRRLHSRVSSLLRVGAPSVDGALATWGAADLSQWTEDARFGKAARSIRLLGESAESYCKASSPNT